MILTDIRLQKRNTLIWKRSQMEYLKLKTNTMNLQPIVIKDIGATSIDTVSGYGNQNKKL